MTAKGFPDEATIDLLKCIYKSTRCRMFYLGDLDPYGLAIYYNYKKRLGYFDDGRTMEWLGLNAEDVTLIRLTHAGIAHLGIQVRKI